MVPRKVEQLDILKKRAQCYFIIHSRRQANKQNLWHGRKRRIDTVEHEQIRRRLRPFTNAQNEGRGGAQADSQKAQGHVEKRNLPLFLGSLHRERMRAILPIALLMVTLCVGYAQAQQSARTPPKWKQEFQRARLVWEKGEADRALAILGKALALAPDSAARAQIAFRYADWYHQLRHYTEARQWYEKCLALAPPGSDLVRRARDGLYRLPSTLPTPAYPTSPPPTVPLWTSAPHIPAKEVSVTLFLAGAFVVSLLVLLVLLQWASGWRREAFFAQVMLSMLLSGGVAMLFPLLALVFTEQFTPQSSDWIAGLLTIGGIVCLAFSARVWQQGQLLRRTPLTRLRSASHGFLKVRGMAEPAFGIVTSQVGNIPAIYLNELSERYVRRTETYYDSRSKRWKTRTVYRWETIHCEVQRVNFLLDDGTGKAIVEVQGAEFYPDHTALFYNYQPMRSFPWFASLGDVRTQLHYIPPNATVTVWARYYEHDLPGTTRDEMRLQYDRFHRCMVVLEGHEGKVYTARTGAGLALALLGTAMLLGVLYILLNPGAVSEYITY